MAVRKASSTTDKTAAAQKKPKPDKTARRANLAFAIFVLAWVALAMTASQLVIAYPMSWLLGESFTKPFWTCLYYGLAYLLTLVLVILLPPRLYQTWQKSRPSQQVKAKTSTDSANATENPLATNKTELGVQHLPTFVDIGLAPIGYVAYLILAGIFTSIMGILPWFNADEAQNTGFTYFTNTPERVVAMLALVFIAPIAEEIIMRGWLYGKLRSRFSLVVAMLLTSLLFGVLHGQWNIGVGVFALSLVLCSLREITGTIWSGMLLHILSNGIAFYLVYIAL